MIEKEGMRRIPILAAWVIAVAGCTAPGATGDVGSAADTGASLDGAALDSSVRGDGGSDDAPPPIDAAPLMGCWVDLVPSGVCSSGTLLCPGQTVVACSDGHVYTRGCMPSGSTCACDCLTDGMSGGTPCTQDRVDCSSPMLTCANVASAAACGFPAEVGGATNLSCRCDAECPSVLPHCINPYGGSTGNCSSHAWGTDLSCDVDAAVPDAGPTCASNTDCPANQVCSGHCYTQNCRMTVDCPASYTCVSGVCMR
jgi:hypothetical protein